MEDETVSLRLRLPIELHRHLGEIAKRNGRSLNSEMIDRLQTSVDSTDPTDQPSFGNPHLRMIGKRIAQAAALVEIGRGKAIADDATTCAMALAAMRHALELYSRPPGELELSSEEVERRGRDIGRLAVHIPPEDIDQLVRDPAANRWGEMILKMLVIAGARLDETGRVRVELDSTTSPESAAQLGRSGSSQAEPPARS
jgi:hypothetical protein